MSIVLLIGGPADGKVYEVADRSQPLHAAVPNRDVIARYMTDDPTEVPDVMFKTVIYYPQDLWIWGTRVVVHVAKDTPLERMEATVHTHLLTPLAHSLMRGA